MINTTNRSGTLPTKTISIVDTIACCKCDNNDSSYTRVRSISHIRSSMAAAPISFCFGAGEDIVTFSTSRPDRQNRTRLEPSTATSSFQVRKIQLPKEIIGLIQSSRRTFLQLQTDSRDYVETKQNLKPVILRASRAYTEQLSNCIELLDDIVDMMNMEKWRQD